MKTLHLVHHMVEVLLSFLRYRPHSSADNTHLGGRFEFYIKSGTFLNSEAVQAHLEAAKSYAGKGPRGFSTII